MSGWKFSLARDHRDGRARLSFELGGGVTIEFPLDRGLIRTKKVLAAIPVELCEKVLRVANGPKRKTFMKHLHEVLSAAEQLLLPANPEACGAGYAGAVVAAGRAVERALNALVENPEKGIAAARKAMWEEAAVVERIVNSPRARSQQMLRRLLESGGVMAYFDSLIVRAFDNVIYVLRKAPPHGVVYTSMRDETASNGALYLAVAPGNIVWRPLAHMPGATARTLYEKIRPVAEKLPGEVAEIVAALSAHAALA